MSPTKSPTFRNPILRAVALVGALCALALLAGSVTAGEALGASCGGSRVASKPSVRVKLPSVRTAVKCLINKERSARSLRLNTKLTRAAQGHTRYMYKHGCFSHQCSGEASTSERIRRAGYMAGASSYRVGEVIALNRDKASPRDVVRQWKNSAGHRAQILSAGFKHLGVGMIARRGKAFYTVTLGAKSG